MQKSEYISHVLTNNIITRGPGKALTFLYLPQFHTKQIAFLNLNLTNPLTSP